MICGGEKTTTNSVSIFFVVEKQSISPNGCPPFTYACLRWAARKSCLREVETQYVSRFSEDLRSPWFPVVLLLVSVRTVSRLKRDNMKIGSCFHELPAELIRQIMLTLDWTFKYCFFPREHLAKYSDEVNVRAFAKLLKEEFEEESVLISQTKS